MKPHIICHLFLFNFFISVTSSQSAIKDTNNGNTTTFILPKNEILVVAMKPMKAKSVINYTFAVNQEVMHNGTCNSCYNGTYWQPLLMITKELVRRSYDGKDFLMPGDVGVFSGRTLTLSSWDRVFWQMFSLPLVDDALGVINESQEELIDLPKGDPVFVAVWNRHASGIRVDLRLHNGEEVTSGTKLITAEKGWSIICLYEHFLDDLNSYFHKDKEGRRLGMFVHEEIHYQIFALPLEPGGYKIHPDKSVPGTTHNIIIIAVLVTSVVLVAIYSGHRFFLRKRNGPKLEGEAVININNATFTSEGTSPEEHSGTIHCPDAPRPSSCHDSENSLYGAAIVR